MKQTAFTLAELLIALLILGVIATFTIPKVLQSQQSGEFKSKAKETVAMISGAYEAYKQENNITSSLVSGDLTRYMNYVNVKNSGATDKWETDGGSNNCGTAFWKCIALHNGAVLGYTNTENMSCTTNNCAIYYHLDIDGVSNGVNNSVVMFLYSNGRITSWGTLAPGTVNDGGGYGPIPSYDPPWFGWN